jgi:hypothetical protein
LDFAVRFLAKSLRIGSIAESAVDDLHESLSLRKQHAPDAGQWLWRTADALVKSKIFSKKIHRKEGKEKSLAFFAAFYFLVAPLL